MFAFRHARMFPSNINFKARSVETRASESKKMSAALRLRNVSPLLWPSRKCSLLPCRGTWWSTSTSTWANCAWRCTSSTCSRPTPPRSVKRCCHPNTVSIGKWRDVVDPPSDAIYGQLGCAVVRIHTLAVCGYFKFLSSFEVGGSYIRLDVECFGLAVLRARSKHVLNLGRNVRTGGQNALRNLAIILPFVARLNTSSHSRRYQ